MCFLISPKRIQKTHALHFATLMQITCCFPDCGRVIDARSSHGAEPCSRGRCCDACNKIRVIPARSNALVSALNGLE